MTAKVRSILLIVAAGAAFAAAPAHAQSLSLRLEAGVRPICGAYNGRSGPVEVAFGALSQVAVTQQVSRPAGSVTYRCNNLAGFTRRVTSQNGGFMTLNGDPTTDTARRIPFTLQQTGTYGFSQRQLTNPVVTTHRPGSNRAAFLRGAGGNLVFRAFGVRTAASGAAPAGTRVFAGEYRDTVTITITAN